MSHEIVLDESIEVPRALQETFAYVADFSRIEQWDPGVRSATTLSAGPPGVGSEYRVDRKAGFSLHYTVIEFRPLAQMLMQVESRFFSAREEILFEATPDGTRIRYIARFSFPASLAALSRRFPGVMQGVGKSAMQGLRRALEDAYTAPADAERHALADRLILPGMLGFTRFGYHWHKRRWKPLTVSLRGRTVVVTGATSGLGQAAASQLAELGARVILVGRNRDKAEATRRD